MIPIQQVELRYRRVLLRVDLNVSFENGEITSKKRLLAALATLEHVLDANASVLVISHVGRPKEGQFDERYSLAPIRGLMHQYLGRNVSFHTNWIQGVELKPGEVAIGENVRFLKGETACDRGLSQQLASLCDVFVMDAFAVAHRHHASVTGVVEFAPMACLGLQCQKEIRHLDAALNNPATPLVAIVGGAKIDGKLQALKRLSMLAQTLIVGGGIANTFIAAKGFNVGRSLYEPELIKDAQNIMDIAARKGCEILMPSDAIVSTSLSERRPVYSKPLADISGQDMMLDIGAATCESYCRAIRQAGTIIWNGPVGAFEHPPFDTGTRAITAAVTESDAFSVAGGGDTLVALERFASLDRVSYASTAGGAFLEYVQGHSLPALTALERHAASSRQKFARVV